MAILLDQDARICIQGITGPRGASTPGVPPDADRVVAGVTPGKGGTSLDGIPVYDRVADAVERQGPTSSGIYAPRFPCRRRDLRGHRGGIGADRLHDRGIPVHGDGEGQGGPPGIGVPDDRAQLSWHRHPGRGQGGLHAQLHPPRETSASSRAAGPSPTRTIWQLDPASLGQSTCLGSAGTCGGDGASATSLERFQGDPQTSAIVLIGEIGGTAKKEQRRSSSPEVTKPVVAFVAGRTATARPADGPCRGDHQRRPRQCGRKNQGPGTGRAIVERNPAEIAARVHEILGKRRVTSADGG
jgi:succinyl-CoA synthetase alpha subunit